MNFFERYIFKEFVPYFILSNLFFIFLLLLDKLLNNSEFFFTNNITFLSLIETFLFYLPTFLVFTIPTATLLSSIIVFNRLNTDLEITVIKLSGASNKTFLVPLFSFSLLGVFLSMACSLYISPLGNKLAMDNIRLIVKRISIDNIKEKELYDKIPGLLVYVDKKLNYKTFKGMLIYNKNNNLLILSEKGHIENDNGGRLHFNLKNGSIINEDKGFTNIIYKDFKIDFNIATKWHTIANKEVFLGPLELFKSFKKSPIYKFQFSSNFAVPFASLIMAFYGYFLGFLLKTHSKEICIFISFIVILIYYLFFILFKSLIYENFNPFLAAWMPDLLLMFVLFPFFLKKIYENTL